MYLFSRRKPAQIQNWQAGSFCCFLIFNVYQEGWTILISPLSSVLFHPYHSHGMLSGWNFKMMELQGSLKSMWIFGFYFLVSRMQHWYGCKTRSVIVTCIFFFIRETSSLEIWKCAWNCAFLDWICSVVGLEESWIFRLVGTRRLEKNLNFWFQETDLKQLAG